MVDSDIPIELIYNKTDDIGKLGSMTTTPNQYLEIEKAKLTIYEKNIDKRLLKDENYRKTNKNYNPRYEHAGVSNRMKNNKFNKREMIAAVASHEFGHLDHPLGNGLINSDYNFREEIADYYQHKAIISILKHRISKIESKGIEPVIIDTKELK